LSSLIRALFVVVVLALVAAACGGDDDAAPETSTSVAGDATTTSAPSETTAVPAETTTTAAPTTSSDGPPVDGDLVSVHYTGTLDNGEQFDSSEGREPLQFVVGSGQVIGGFDDAVRDLMVGESVTVRLEPEDAYGEVNPELILDFPIEDVPEEFRVEGIQVLLGGNTPATVIEVTDDTVTVDANHELAGEALTFDIELVSVTTS
jgi:FKBP-type peptidyl-prolyl cis-trans isomerase 2